MGDIDISIEADGWHSLADLEAGIEQAVQAALSHAAPERAKDAAVSILLCDDATMQRLNRDFRAKDKPTNVLSFPAAPIPGEGDFLGDLALGFETCQREAIEEGKTLPHHIAHLVVHGILHLIGYDHETEAEAELMEGQEIAILKGLGIADPYAGAEGGATDES